MILDLHVHSKYSFDSLSEPSDIIKTAKSKGLNGIAITDHNTIQGALAAQKINQDNNFLIIIGSEIATEIGDITGLFLQKEIVSRKSVTVVEEIHNQGGLAVLPHPYKHHKLNDQIIEKIDIIEIFNARTAKEDNQKAVLLAERHNKPFIVGSDAHFCREIGTAKTILKSNDIKSAILNKELTFETKRSPKYVENLSQIVKFTKLKKYNKIIFQLISFFRNLF